MDSILLPIADPVERLRVHRSASRSEVSEAELVQCLDFVTDEPVAAAALAVDGRAYAGRYRLDSVLDRMIASLDAWLPLDGDEDEEGGR